MKAIFKGPKRVLQRIRKFNSKLIPPEQYLDTAKLGVSAFEEAYYYARNFIDGTIHLSGKMFLEDDYHNRRLAEFKGQRRLVVLVPGYMQPPLAFYRFCRYLGIELFDAFPYVWFDFPYSQDLTLSAVQLESVVRDLHRFTQAEEIYLIGHSQGGMIVRTMVQHGMGSDLPVKKCLFLSSPHQGTWSGIAAASHRGLRIAASMFPYINRVQGESGLQLIPGSRFLEELNSRPLPEGIKFTSVYYALDPMIWPPSNGILPYPKAENHFIKKVGHIHPLYCAQAAQITIRALYNEELLE
jgi:triacylglycerol esterase/lipase EstA (alpha/beta hydrolase family)